MRVQMTTHIGGYRDGEEWPNIGGVIDVPDHEAADLIAAGYAKEEIDEANDATEPDGDESARADSDDAAGAGSIEDGDATVPVGKRPAKRPAAKRAARRKS